MRNRWTRLMRALTVAAAAALVVGTAAAQPQQAGPQKPSVPERPARISGHPDLNGIWQALNTAYWNLESHSAEGLNGFPQLGAIAAIPAGQSVVRGGTIPYKPEALAKRKENFDNRLKLDPEIKCYLPGVPRANYMPYPFQVVQGPKYIMMIYTFAGAVRTIYMDEHTDAPADSWMGWSNGHWEGETLVVDTRGFNGQTWFDRAGNFHSDALHVVERYTAASPDHLLYEATFEDPKVFTRPWKVSMPLYRRLEKHAQIMEFRCVEFVEELIYGHLRKKPGS
jgi:hypothetical protein